MEEVLCQQPVEHHEKHRLLFEGDRAADKYGIYCTKCWGWYSPQHRGGGTDRENRPYRPNPNMEHVK